MTHKAKSILPPHLPSSTRFLSTRKMQNTQSIRRSKVVRADKFDETWYNVEREVWWRPNYIPQIPKITRNDDLTTVVTNRPQRIL